MWSLERNWKEENWVKSMKALGVERRFSLLFKILYVLLQFFLVLVILCFLSFLVALLHFYLQSKPISAIIFIEFSQHSLISNEGCIKENARICIRSKDIREPQTPKYYNFFWSISSKIR